MLEKLTKKSFDPHLGSSFRLHAEDSAVELRLVECRGLSGARGRREPFSIVFRAPMDTRLPQNTYRLEHDEMGSLDLFMVPIGPDSEGMRYEAVFT